MPPGDEHDVTETRAAKPLPGGGEPRTWGGFRIVGELGRGGFGRVYHAWDETLARDVALKVVRLPDRTEAATALHEGRMLARVRHRNVVTVYGAQQIGDEVGVWMELIRGRSLAQLVREQGPLGPEEATVVGISVCQALAAVHGAGLLHRDIKATNVMRESGGRILLMDFGAGRESGPPRGGVDLAGTPVYMAPEVLAEGAASPSSDLYSVGVLLYYVVTGDYPVAGDSLLALSLAHRRGERRLLADRRPDLPDGFIRAIERALSPRPAERPSSAGEMLRDLAGGLPGAASWEARKIEALHVDLATPPAVTPGGRADAAPGLNRTAVWAGGAALAAGGVGLLGFLTSAAFNQSLGRDASFSSDRPLDWWIYGARSLVWPLVLSAVVVLGGRLIVSAWQLFRRFGGSLRATLSPHGRRLRRMARNLGADSPVALSQWIVLFQVLSIALLGLRYQGLLTAVSFPADVGPGLLALLAPENTAPLNYRSLLTLTMVAGGASWYALLSQPAVRPLIHGATIVAGAAAMALALLMLVVPYRLLYHNAMPRTALNGERCYEVGARGAQVLLYCPDAPAPRVKIAERTMLSDSGITVLESIFSQAPPSR
jgi:serine/threonine-protein kinase